MLKTNGTKGDNNTNTKQDQKYSTSQAIEDNEYRYTERLQKNESRIFSYTWLKTLLEVIRFLHFCGRCNTKAAQCQTNFDKRLN